MILVALILVLLNAFFVAAEFSMVKMRATRIQTIKQIYGLRGRLLERIHEQLDAYLSACQLGITLASLGLGWVGEPAFAYILGPFFQFLGMQSTRLIEISSFLVAFTLISFLHIVIGELMPKSIAIRRAEFIAIWTAIPLYGFYWFMYPAIWLLNYCSNFLLSLFKLNVSSNNEEGIYSTEELKLILSGGMMHEAMQKDERQILEHVLDFSDLTVTDIMRSTDSMVSLEINDSLDILSDKIVDNQYSRYPVLDAKSEEIIGIIHVKDLFADAIKQNEIKALSTYLRPILKVSHRLTAIELLRQFKKGGSHFALIYKNKHTVLGFITLDNLLHVLIGKIKDEFHKTQEDWVKNADGTLSTIGDCSLYSLEKALDTTITLHNNEKNLSTLYGLLISRCGVIPKVGDIISINEFDALIEQVEGQYLKLIKIIPKVSKNNV